MPRDPARGENEGRRGLPIVAVVDEPSPARIAVAWLLVGVWATVIWQLGTDGFSMGRTGPVLEWLIALFGADVDYETRFDLHVLLRKSAHFLEYALLALLAFRAAWVSAGRARILTACWIALFLVGTLAAADEIRQSVSAVRTGSPWDVVIDLTGGCVGLVGVSLLARRMRRLRRLACAVEQEPSPG